MGLILLTNFPIWNAAPFLFVLNFPLSTFFVALSSRLTWGYSCVEVF